ncbi:DUF4135 domain-containing protein [Corallococcus sp. BB11-1]|uniref:DUF4135 domain-containing protein n=1 Tax=Corallococcus sp. BB11-1 TaxID=2996783 RepID=UPI0010F0CA64|nr:DUF4135 domain-containing protein [Corallococcus sp. BB11-1]MCY1031794.1 DUF4135 domain-containing protein [Corallococcus sp. BB11-1]RYZ46533.1 MAG: DUF4135 domain-containing protein [Myxococcaceae bacterium]
MYDTEIDQALTQAAVALRRARHGGLFVPDPVPPHPWMRAALRMLVDRITGYQYGPYFGSSLLPLLLSSNFLTRAAVDLFGPCTCAHLLATVDGDTSVLANLRAYRLSRAAWGLGRGLVGTVKTLTVTRAERVWRLIDQVVQAHVTFGADLLSRLAWDRDLLRRAFGITGTLSTLHVTGSDPHRGGHRVVLLRYSDGRGVVYKPSDLTFQLMLMGDRRSYELSRTHHPALSPYTDSLFAALDPDLPAIRIIAFPHSRGEYGYMQRIEKTPVIPDADQGMYFRKLGRLVAVAALFGITDLHEENVMATADGPYLIDAEMAFCYPGVNTNLINHCALQRVLHITPEEFSNVGGVFTARYENNAWEINKLSAPYDAQELNAGFKATALGGAWVSGRTYPNVLLHGIREEVDRIALRLGHVHRWIAQAYAVKPAARVLLSTTVMCGLHVEGVRMLLEGTLPTDAQAPNLSFGDWLTWYGGKHNAVPAALVEPHSRQSLLDPTRVQGVTYTTASAGGASAANLVEVWNTMNGLSTPMGVTQFKTRLKTALEQTLRCGPLA